MSLFITTAALFGLVAAIAVLGRAGSGTMPRSRRVQPDTREVHHVIVQEAELARNRVHRQLAGLGY